RRVLGGGVCGADMVCCSLLGGVLLGECRGQAIVSPPETDRVCPGMSCVAGEARDETAMAGSPGWAMRRSGSARSSARRNFGLTSEMLANSGVSAGPGQTTFAVIPARALSRARVLVKATIPPLHAEYTASPLEPTRAASEAMF